MNNISGSHLGEKPKSVTSDRVRNKAALAKERQRKRRDAMRPVLLGEPEPPPSEPDPLLHSREEWREFLDPETLSRKAGCDPDDLPAVVLKELVDNALDAGGMVRVELDGEGWVVSDTGKGLDPAQVPKIFCVNRELTSSKLRRMPTRGMLGNGTRVVMAWARELVVETRGVQMHLAVSEDDGTTIVTSTKRVPHRAGTKVWIRAENEADGDVAQKTAALARLPGIKVYRGHSSPWWYPPSQWYRQFSDAPRTATAADVVRNLGLTPPVGLDPARLASSLKTDDTTVLMGLLRRTTRKVPPKQIGELGPDVFHGFPGYGKRQRETQEAGGALIPYTVECYAKCVRATWSASDLRVADLYVRYGASLARLSGRKDKPDGIGDCFNIWNDKTLDIWVKAPPGQYVIVLSLIAPHVQLAGDDKTPVFEPFEQAITEAVGDAMRRAHKALAGLDKKVSVKDAAWAALPDAYVRVSDNGRLPADARQLMYAMRRRVLLETGRDALDDGYVTQVLIPDYIAAHPEETKDWDVVYAARGDIREPHTGRIIPLGTVSVRNYLRSMSPAQPPVVQLADRNRWHTIGPENRYRTALHIEKQGFDALISKQKLAERFDLAPMSPKGMSNTSTRELCDGLVGKVDRVLVLHDFDVSGFGIFHTLRGNNRRYTYSNKVEFIDIGLRLTDIQAIAGLEDEKEPVTVAHWDATARRLRSLGVTEAELKFLRTHRLELNALTSRQLIDFIERKLIENGVKKVIPTPDVIREHARRVLQHREAEKLLATLPPIQDAALPSRIEEMVIQMVAEYPELSWDDAVVRIVTE
jgi:hypothetical protein